jgi:hypothetical protein
MSHAKGSQNDALNSQTKQIGDRNLKLNLGPEITEHIRGLARVRTPYVLPVTIPFLILESSSWRHCTGFPCRSASASHRIPAVAVVEMTGTPDPSYLERRQVQLKSSCPHFGGG